MAKRSGTVEATVRCPERREAYRALVDIAWAPRFKELIVTYFDSIVAPRELSNAVSDFRTIDQAVRDTLRGLRPCERGKRVLLALDRLDDFFREQIAKGGSEPRQ